MILQQLANSADQEYKISSWQDLDAYSFFLEAKGKQIQVLLRVFQVLRNINEK